MTTKTFSLTEGKLKNSRMRTDYEFLKNLENILEPGEGEEILDTAETEDILDTKEEMRRIVQEAVTFLEERDEFWTNVK